MNTDLSAEDAASIERLIATGELKTPPEAVAAVLRLLLSHQKLRAEIQLGADQLDAGQGIDGDVVFAKLQERGRKLTEPAE